MLTSLKLLLCLGRKSTLPKDYYEKETQELKREQEIDNLATNISSLIIGVSGLVLEPNPYPPSVFPTIEKLMKLQSIIMRDKEETYFDDALSLAKNMIFEIDVDEDVLLIRNQYFNEFCNKKNFDLDGIQMEALDRYFSRFRDYWEKVISDLKRKNAVINRRKYLIELIKQLKSLLAQNKISKYNQLLSEYQDFNYTKLSDL